MDGPTHLRIIVSSTQIRHIVRRSASWIFPGHAYAVIKPFVGGGFGNNRMYWKSQWRHS
ncbi:hypothetical protein ACLB1T_05510 [Escherichia coli]